MTSRPNRHSSGRDLWRFGAGTFSQAPQAVRSARSSRWDRAFPASARADSTFHADKRDAVRLTVQVHRLRDISRTAAIRTVVRAHS